MKALITGSSGLIGTELCRKYLAHGYDVYGLDQGPGELKDPHFTFLKCDLGNEASIKKALKNIESLDVVINNAAATDITFKSFESMTLNDWERGIAVNLTSIFIISKLTHKFLVETQGSMINISSTRHLMSEKDTLVYSASKGGIVSLTHSLAVSWGKDVRINSISPGWIASPSEKLKKKDHDQHPAGRVGKPEDIANFAFYLSSEEASFITGQDFIIDGGMTRKMIYV